MGNSNTNLSSNQLEEIKKYAIYIQVFNLDIEKAKIMNNENIAKTLMLAINGDLPYEKYELETDSYGRIIVVHVWNPVYGGDDVIIYDTYRDKIIGLYWD